MTELHATGLTVDINGVTVLTDAAIHAPAGSFVGLLGPNGSGKSTLLRAVARILRPTAGTVTLDGVDVWRLPARAAAQRAALVTQHGPVEFDFTVGETVGLGRLPHQRPLQRTDQADDAIVAAALQRVGVADLQDRLLATLSGGERQRVLIAQALAQQPKVLILDEPTNHLDIAAQLDILELARSLGVTVLAALHDLNHASTYCDHLVVLRNGRVAAAGPPADVLTDQLIGDVFAVDVHSSTHPTTGRRLLAFSPRTPAKEIPDAHHPAPEDCRPDAAPRPARRRLRERLATRRALRSRPAADGVRLPGVGDELR